MTSEAVSEKAPTLLIYLPCYRDFQLSIKQANKIREIIRAFPTDNILKIKIMISINGVDLSDEILNEIKEVTDFQIVYPFGISGDINITQGFMHAIRLNSEFLWILSANDAVSDTCIETIDQKLVRVPEVDLLVATSTENSNIRHIESVFDSENREVPFGLISSVVYRTKRTANNFDTAIQLNWTGWGQLATIEASCISRGGLLVSFVDEKLFYSRSRKELENARDERNRIRNGYAHSFFGMPIVIGTLFAQNQKKRTHLLNRWIRSNWYLVHFFLNTDFKLWESHAASNQRWIRKIAFSIINEASLVYRILFLVSRNIKFEFFQDYKLASHIFSFLKKKTG